MASLEHLFRNAFLVSLHLHKDVRFPPIDLLATGEAAAPAM